MYGLRQISDVKTVRSELVECHGVGPKVADCVALFSLDSIEGECLQALARTVAAKRDLCVRSHCT